MFTFLLILFIIFIVIPVFRFGLSVWKMRNAYNRAMNDARTQAREQARRAEADSRPGGWSAPFRKKAKIVNPNEGEYVEWEDIEISETETTENTRTRRRTRVSEYTEQRISDAEWEDIKPK